MNQSEVVEWLKIIAAELNYIAEAKKALTEAIRCVELMPELVKALEIVTETIADEDTHSFEKELLKKAKGMME